MQALKGIGLEKAKYLLSLAEAYEGEEIASAPAPRLKPKQLAFLEEVGERVMSQLPASTQGRKTDPNSTLGRIRTALHTYLKEHGPATSSHLWLHLPQATGLPLATCKANAYQVKGVERSNGLWKLPSNN